MKSGLKFTLSLACALAVLSGCGDSDDTESTLCSQPVSGGGVLKDFCPPTDPGAKGVLFTASGEVLGLGGYGFPPASEDDPAFVDGWEVRFTRYLVTVNHITLSENPDKSPSDQSQTDGVVAKVDGPFAVDLHQGGSLPGKGGSDEKAVALAAVKGQNQKGDAAFDSARRYSFGFDAVAATADAQNVNLDADGLADYKEMIQKGYAVMMVGTATWKGGANCTSSDPSYDFSKFPTTVNFRLGFKTPTSYLNCQNPDLDPAAPFDGEEHQRGVAIKDNASAVAQVTFHSDHPFWDSFEHDSPAHFDQLAAHYRGDTAAPATPPTVRLEDFAGVSFTPVVDAQGNAVPYRSCLDSYTPPTGQKFMTFDTKGVPVNPSGNPATSIRDYADYCAYNQSTLGHLNADGLCFVKRNYASPQ